VIPFLRRLWNGSDLPRDDRGRVRTPRDVREGGRGTPANRAAVASFNIGAPPALQSTHPMSDVGWGSRQEAAVGAQVMTRERFEAMGHREQMEWHITLRRYHATTGPQHHVVLKWWGP
jgi:hypothetical protein